MGVCGNGEKELLGESDGIGANVIGAGFTSCVGPNVIVVEGAGVFLSSGNNIVPITRPMPVTSRVMAKTKSQFL